MQIVGHATICNFHFSICNFLVLSTVRGLYLDPPIADCERNPCAAGSRPCLQEPRGERGITRGEAGVGILYLSQAQNIRIDIATEPRRDGDIQSAAS